MDSNLRIYNFLTMFSLKVATAYLDVSLISISSNSSSYSFFCLFKKFRALIELTTFIYLGEHNNLQKWVDSSRKARLKMHSPDEGLQHSIGGSSELKVFPISVSFSAQKAEFAHGNYPRLN